MRINFLSRVDRFFEGYFFCKADDGQDVFYPWGWPGEGVMADGKKRKILSSIYALMIFIVLWSFLGVFAEEFNMISRRAGTFLYLFSCAWLVPLCVCVMYFLVKKKEFVVISKQKRPISWTYLELLFLSVFLQILAAYFSANYEPPFVLLMVCGLGGILTLHFFIKILKTRGLYFSRK